MSTKQKTNSQIFQDSNDIFYPKDELEVSDLVKNFYKKNSSIELTGSNSKNFIGNKSKKYFEKTNDGKQILRKALSQYLPELITNAEKKGFSSPDATWFKNQSIEWVKEKLFSKKSKIYDYLDFSKSKSLLEDHFDGKENRRLFIWSLLNLDEYLIQNFE